MTTTNLLWSDALLLGYKPMDDRHEEFVHCVSRLRDTNPVDVVRDMDAVLRHLIEHFEEERKWMFDSDYPSTECHVDEHCAVIQSARMVHAKVSDHLDVAEARRFADALADWFPKHADYMDSALSHWMSKRAHGGIPVVLRRATAVSTDIAAAKSLD